MSDERLYDVVFTVQETFRVWAKDEKDAIQKATWQPPAGVGLPSEIVVNEVKSFTVDLEKQAIGQEGKQDVKDAS